MTDLEVVRYAKCYLDKLAHYSFGDRPASVSMIAQRLNELANLHAMTCLEIKT